MILLEIEMNLSLRKNKTGKYQNWWAWQMELIQMQGLGFSGRHSCAPNIG